MSPIIEAVLTVEAVYGKPAAVKLLVELLEELERVYRAKATTSEGKEEK